MIHKLVKICRLGQISYAKGLKLQQYIADLHINNSKNVNDTLILLEHNPVYTIGIRTKGYTDDDIERLKKTGADFYATNRGGLITFHGPGQLIVYPIINLKNFTPSMKWYITQLENAVIQLCEKFELRANTSPHTGVWIGDNKICAIGVHGSRYITTHGLAFNCNPDLTWFDHIIPCGIQNKGVTSLSKELNRVISVDDVIPEFVNCFSNTFNCSYISCPEHEIEDFNNI